MFKTLSPFNALAIATLPAMLLAVALPALAVAHPLGNFTVNRYNGLTVAASWTQLDRVVDLAELPTVQARHEMDSDGDRDVTSSEAAAWAGASCNTTPSQVTLSIEGRPAQLVPTGLGITFASGQAGLDTLRLVCTYQASYSLTGGTVAVEFADATYPSRQGWREIVVTGRGVELSGADQFAKGTSNRLRSYPVDAGGAIRAQASADFSFVPAADNATVDFPSVDDAVAFGSPADSIVGRSSSAAAVPGGVSDLPAELTSLIQANDLSLPAVLLALGLAALVGAFHAATPGHGKTLMAAYLVGTRGTVRHALGLGLTVTFSHTIGVLGLGAIVMIAGAAIPSERLLPILGLGSGVVVTLMGVILLAQRIRATREEREHQGAHEHGLEHSHGPIRHSHLPTSEVPLRRRNLVALGVVGGLVPSASAILILVGSIAAGRPAFGLVLTIAFGAGMAAVLVGVGILLVHARSLVERMPSRNVGQVMAYAPVLTALVFVVVGMAISVQSGMQLQ
jgi:nickel/cobalt transporter (NicO) family protein